MVNLPTHKDTRQYDTTNEGCDVTRHLEGQGKEVRVSNCPLEQDVYHPSYYWPLRSKFLIIMVFCLN